MAIVFAAIVPHPPVLMPGIGEAHWPKLKQTIRSFQQLEQDLYAAQPQAVVVISPHGRVQAEAFSINLHPSYVGRFTAFGDHATKLKFRADTGLVQRIREYQSVRAEVPLVLTSDEDIDYGVSVPLSRLLTHLPNVPVVPITTSGLDAAVHFVLGQYLADRFIDSGKRVAVIASADLSHRLTKTAPGGYSKTAAKFDQRVVELLKSQQIEQLIGLDHAEVKREGVCGWRAIVTLLGTISKLRISSSVLSYESPFGVGYVVVHYKFE